MILNDPTNVILNPNVILNDPTNVILNNPNVILNDPTNVILNGVKNLAGGVSVAEPAL